MASVEYISDFEDSALRLTLSRHRTKARISALLRGFAAASQLLEDALLGLSSDALFGNATGATLDLYGALLGEPRSGLDDLTYRNLMAARALANQSQGTPDEMIEILLVLAPNALVVRHRNLYPASIVFEVVTEDPPDAQYLARVGAIMRLSKAGGVSFGGVWAVLTPFGFATNPIIAGYSVGKLAYSF